MKFYVVGRMGQLESVRRVQAIVRDSGHEVVHDWTEGDAPRYVYADEPARAAGMAAVEREAAQTADAVVLYAEPSYGGRREGPHAIASGLGLYVEIGIALGLHKTVVLIGEVRESVFWYLPEVVRCKDIDEFVEWVA